MTNIPGDDKPTRAKREARERGPFEKLVREAAIEAEYRTGEREATEAEAERHVFIRVGRIIVGWILVLVGIAGLALPGPGWLIVLLGLSMLPYAWTNRMIRIIRKRIPGIPEDGRVPTRTWVMMGLFVVASTGFSLWWGLRDNEAKGDSAAASSESLSGSEIATIELPDGPAIVLGGLPEGDQQQLGRIYAEVVSIATNGSTFESLDNPCETLKDGRSGIAVFTTDDASTCFGTAEPETFRKAAEAEKIKVFAPVTVNGIEYFPVLAHRIVAPDDEPTETAVDAVTNEITGGDEIEGSPNEVAKDLLQAAGLEK